MKRADWPFIVGTEVLVALPMIAEHSSNPLLPLGLWAAVSLLYLGLLKLYGSGSVVEMGLLAVLLSAGTAMVARAL